MEDFVPFDISKKLKEKEFDWETSNVYEKILLLVDMKIILNLQSLKS